jgi:hypothetical protein
VEYDRNQMSAMKGISKQEFKATNKKA